MSKPQAEASQQPSKKSAKTYIMAGAALAAAGIIMALPIAGAVWGAAVGAPYLIGGGVAHGVWGFLVGSAYGGLLARGILGTITVAQAVKKDGFLKTFSQPLVAAKKLVKSLRTVGVRKTFKKVWAWESARLDQQEAAKKEKAAVAAEKNATWYAEQVEKTAEKAAAARATADEAAAKPDQKAAAKAEKKAKSAEWNAQYEARQAEKAAAKAARAREAADDFAKEKGLLKPAFDAAVDTSKAAATSPAAPVSGQKPSPKKPTV